MRKTNFVSATGLCFCLVFLFSCKKNEQAIVQNAVSDSSFISITNASPTLSSLLPYLNNQKLLLADTPLSYGRTTYSTYVNNGNAVAPVIKQIPYINIAAGYQQLSFGSPAVSNYFASVSGYFRPGANYSIFVTDTVNHGQLRCVLLEDKIGKTDTSKAQIRFLNLAPDAPAMDIWAFPDAGSDGFQLFANCGYLPDNYGSLVQAQSFSLIGTGPYYLVATAAGTTNILQEGGLIIHGQDVISIFASGFVSGTGNQTLGIGVISYKQ